MDVTDPPSAQGTPWDENDGEWFKYRRTAQELADLPDPTYAEALRDAAAKVMALAWLLIQHNIITEDEFRGAHSRALTAIDEHYTKAKDDRDRLCRQLLRERLVFLHEWFVRNYVSKHKEAQLNILRVPLDRQTYEDLKPGNSGRIWIRIIDPDCEGLDGDVRRRDFIVSLQAWAEQQQEEVTVLMLTPGERAKSPLSLDFDNIIEARGLKEIQP